MLLPKPPKPPPPRPAKSPPPPPARLGTTRGKGTPPRTGRIEFQRPYKKCARNFENWDRAFGVTGRSKSSEINARQRAPTSPPNWAIELWQVLQRTGRSWEPVSRRRDFFESVDHLGTNFDSNYSGDW